jgi:transcriptional regulator with XRE-family HTH domain
MSAKKLEVGARVKQLRKAREMTLREVGMKLGVAANTVNRWERGESSPTRANLVAMSDLFAVDPSWLMFGITKSNTKKDEEKLLRKLRLLSDKQYQNIESLVDDIIGSTQEEGENNGRA